MKKALLTLILTIFAFGFFTHDVSASEGFIILDNPNLKTRCYAQSVLTAAKKYNLVVACRDLVYPLSNDTLYYALWANPGEGKDPQYITTLGLGRTATEINFPFTSLFVTSELADKPKTPSSRVVLFGEVRPIEYMGNFEEELEKLETKYEKQQEEEEKLIKDEEEAARIAEEETQIQEEKEKVNIKDVVTKYAFLPVAIFLGIILLLLFLVRKK